MVSTVEVSVSLRVIVDSITVVTVEVVRAPVEVVPPTTLVVCAPVEVEPPMTVVAGQTVVYTVVTFVTVVRRVLGEAEELDAVGTTGTVNVIVE